MSSSDRSLGWKCSVSFPGSIYPGRDLALLRDNTGSSRATTYQNWFRTFDLQRLTPGQSNSRARSNCSSSWAFWSCKAVRWCWTLGFPDKNGCASGAHPCGWFLSRLEQPRRMSAVGKDSTCGRVTSAFCKTTSTCWCAQELQFWRLPSLYHPKCRACTPDWAGWDD